MSAINKLLDYTDKLTKHAVFRNPYFHFLKSNKFTPELYAFHRANFFFRTEATVKSVAQVCAKAAIQDDQDTLLLFSYILNEECGNGDKLRCHESLMERSHNVYGAKEYQLTPLKVKEAKATPDKAFAEKNEASKKSERSQNRRAKSPHRQHRRHRR